MRKLAVAAFLVAGVVAARAEFDRVGQCEMTRISAIGSRLQGDPSSGTSIEYENGVFGVSYSRVKAVIRSRVGDKVIVCVVNIEENCPSGTTPGKRFSAFNFRTKQDWKLDDSSHQCGGA